ncbi:MAG TPA: PEGA domain-containing protein [Thermotogota bacterium]|nr:PEGA domain-containing protein [Thermotogota bacterium]
MKNKSVSLLVFMLCLSWIAFPLLGQGEELVTKLLVSPVVQSEYHVGLSLNLPAGSSYLPGEKVSMQISPNRDSYILVWDLSPSGEIHLIFPNQYDQGNFIAAGQTLSLPREGYEFVVEEPYGVEWIQVVASERQFPEYDSWKRQFSASVFPELDPGAVMAMKNALDTRISISPTPDVATAFSHFYVGPAPSVGQVSLSSSPADASIFLDGVLLSETTPLERMDLPSGIHFVQAIKQGFKTHDFSFVLLPGEHRFFSFNLEPLLSPASIIIDPQPARASVFFEGVALGQGKKVLEGLVPGEYSVEVRLNGFQTFSGKVSVSSGETRTLEVNLDPQVASLTIQVFPSNALVKMGKDWMEPQNGLLQCELPPGSYPLLVEAQGYHSVERLVQLSPGTNPPVSIELMPMRATLTILSDPSEATVYINGFSRGKTPLSLSLGSGTFELKIEKENFGISIQQLDLLPGENRELAVVLESQLGYLDIPTPEGISVYVDGAFRGWAPTLFPLKEGLYLLVLKDKGVERFRQQVTIVAGETLTVSPQ